MLVESGIREHFACGIRNPWPQSPENTAQGIWNPTNESRIQVSTDNGWNSVPGIQNLPRGTQNPRPSCIPLHEVEKRRFVGSQVLYSTANDPQPQMIPRPQMIPKMDRK